MGLTPWRRRVRDGGQVRDSGRLHDGRRVRDGGWLRDDGRVRDGGRVFDDSQDDVRVSDGVLDGTCAGWRPYETPKTKKYDLNLSRIFYFLSLTISYQNVQSLWIGL